MRRTHRTWSPEPCAQVPCQGRQRRRLVVSGFVLLSHVGGDTTAIADQDAVLSRPGPDIAAALTSRRVSRRSAALSTPRLTSMSNVRRELLAQRGRVLLVQINLVLEAAQPEPDRLIRRPPDRSSSSATAIFVAIPDLRDRKQISARYPIMGDIRATLPSPKPAKTASPPGGWCCHRMKAPNRIEYQMG